MNTSITLQNELSPLQNNRNYILKSEKQRT